MILGPVLLEVGMHTEAVQATTAVFVFLSSSIATLQFALASEQTDIWHYALWYGAVVVVATLLGQWLCDVAVRKHKRRSAITLSIAGLLLFSLMALSVVGFKQVVEDFRLGRPMWFSSTRLCSASIG